MNWQYVASSVIAKVHKSLPSDADLKTRKRALRQARPYEFRVTSWGRKVWAKHARNYLEKYGLEPLAMKRGNSLPLSPLERMMQKSLFPSSAPISSSQAADEKTEAHSPASRSPHSGQD